ncbi:hypothetical protein M8C21_029104, partial [Ambrosia artemisiifolia]
VSDTTTTATDSSRASGLSPKLSLSDVADCVCRLRMLYRHARRRLLLPGTAVYGGFPWWLCFFDFLLSLELDDVEPDGSITSILIFANPCSKFQKLFLAKLDLKDDVSKKGMESSKLLPAGRIA